MATQVATRARVTVTVDAAAKEIARRFLGDLHSLNRYYEMGGPQDLADMAHDLEVGLAACCIESVRLCFFASGTDQLLAVYDYRVGKSGGLTSAPHSGRFTFDPLLKNARSAMRVTPSNSAVWNDLKRNRRLRIGWSQASSLDTSRLVASDDGAYAAGDLALIRSYLRRANDE